MIHYLDQYLMQEMCYRLAVSFFNKIEEPLPEFHSHNIHLLQSSLNLPKASFQGHDLYPELIDKGAILFYTLIKNHPFPNGNKRIATAALLVFFYLNDHWLASSQNALYRRAIIVADSNPKTKEKIIADLNKWLKKHLVNESNSSRFTKLMVGLWQALVLRMSRKRKNPIPVVEMKKGRGK